MAWINRTGDLIKINDTRRRGQAVWELWLDNWGNEGTLADANSIAFPAGSADQGITLGSIYAASIAPASMIDRCILLWTPGGFGNPTGSTAPNAVREYYRYYLSVKNPAYFYLPGDTAKPSAGVENSITVIGVAPVAGGLIDPNNASTQQGFYNAVRFRDTYSPSGANPDTTAPFGTALNAINTYTWTNPELRVQFWVKPPTAGLPLFRAPYVFSSVDISLSSDLTLYKVIPLHGRRKVTIRLREMLGGTMGYKIGTVTSSPQETGARMLETQVATGSVTAFNTANLQLNDMDLTYVTIYANETAGQAGLNFQVFAED